MTFAFSHGRQFILPDNVPVVSSVLDSERLVVGFSSGTIRIYKNRQFDCHVEYYKPSHAKQLQPLISTIHSAVSGECFVVGYADGTVCSYSSRGKLINHTTLPFRPRGIDTFNSSYLIWGFACEMVLLNSEDLGVYQRWGSLKDWPIPVPLFDNRILIIYRDGDVEQVHVPTMQLTQHPPLDLFSQPQTSHGHFHSVDMVVSIKRVGPVSWLVVQRSGWTLYKWEEGQFVNQISSGSTQVLTSVVTSNDEDEVFGVVCKDGTLVWVHDSNVQLVDPPNTDQVVQVMYHHKVIYAIVLGADIRLYTCDTRGENKVLAWEESSTVLDQFSSPSDRYISSVHETDVVTAQGADVRIHTLPEFLTGYDNQHLPDVSLTGNDKVTVLSSQAGFIIAGTQQGRLVTINKAEKRVVNNLQMFASPVERLYSWNTNIIAVSTHSTVCVVDLITLAKKLVPGNNVGVSSLEFKEEILTIRYENGEVRSWNLATDEQVDDCEPGGQRLFHEYDGFLVPITSDGQTRPVQPIVLIRVEKLIAFLSPYLESDKIKLDAERLTLVRALISSLIPLQATKSWQQAVETPPRVGQVEMNASFITVSRVDQDNAYVVAVWIMLVRLMMKNAPLPANNDQPPQHVESVSRLLMTLAEGGAHSLDIQGFASLASTAESQFIRQSARSCLKELVKNNSPDTDDQSIDAWCTNLPSKSSDIYSEKCLQALEILASWVITHKQQIKRNSTISKEVSESLQLYLTESAPSEHRDAAVEFIGKGWSVWQEFFNPLNVIDALIQILYQNSGLVPLVNRCVYDIATQNITLLISALVTHLSSADNSLDGRVTAIRLLTNLVNSALIQPEHLSTIISSIVKTLDPSDATLREASSIHRTSIITESTQFLSVAMNKHPDYLAFHKPQQRLVVSTVHGALLALVYDLRTGTVVASLSSQFTSHQLTKLKFSPDGKQVAGVIDNQTATWKLGYGFMSLLQSLSLSSSPEIESTAIAPTSLIPECTDFDWNEDNTIRKM